jgi:Mn2+/Fe2+ NRAMP family transporter
MQAQRRVRTLPGIVGTAAAAALLAGTLLDIAGVAGAISPPPGTASYVLIAAGIAAACAVVLLRVLSARRSDRSDRRITITELAMIGVLLGAWMLRGHREVPPDMPLVAAQVLAIIGLAFAARARRRMEP